MPAELRQVGGNLVPGVGASSRGPGGGGRGAGLPGRTRFCSAERPAGGGYCLSFGPARSAPGQAGRRGGVSAPPGGGGCARRGAGPRGLWGPGAGAPGGATPRLEARPGSGWVHPRVAPRTGAWAGVVGEGLPEQRLCAGGMPSPERSAGRGLQLLGGARWASPPLHTLSAGSDSGDLRRSFRSFNGSPVCRGSAREGRGGGRPCPRAEAGGGLRGKPRQSASQGWEGAGERRVGSQHLVLRGFGVQ